MWPTSISYGTHNAFPVASWDSEGCTLWNHLDLYTVVHCEFGELFSHTVFIYVIVGKYAIWMQPFFRRNRWMKEWLFQSFWDFINLLGRCTDCQFLPWGGDLHHLMDLVSFWTSYIVRKKTTALPKKLPAELELAFPRIWLTFFFFSVCWLTGNHSYFPALRSPTNLDEPNFRCPDAYNSLLSVSWPSQKKHNVIKIRGRSEIEWFIMVILLIMQRGWRKSWKVIINVFLTITVFTPLWSFYCVLRWGILL